MSFRLRGRLEDVSASSPSLGVSCIVWVSWCLFLFHLLHYIYGGGLLSFASLMALER